MTSPQPIPPEAMKAAREVCPDCHSTCCVSPGEACACCIRIASALVAYAQAAVEQEREACARVADAEELIGRNRVEHSFGMDDVAYSRAETAQRIGDSIRARQQRTEGDAK